MNESCNITGTPCRASQSRWRAPRKWLRVCSSTLRKCVAPSVGLSFFFFLGVKTPTHTLTRTYTHTLRPCATPSVCFFCTLQHTHTYIHTIRGRVSRRQRVSVCTSPRTHTHTRTPFEDVCRAVDMTLLCVSAHTHSHTCQVGIYRWRCGMSHVRGGDG